MKNLFKTIKQRLTWLFYGAKIEIQSMGDAKIHNCRIKTKGVRIWFMKNEEKHWLSISDNHFINE